MRYNYSRLGNKKIVYDGETLSDYFIVTEMSVSPMPDITANSQSMASGVGEWFSNIKLGTRKVEMTLRLNCESPEYVDAVHCWREVRPLIHKSEPKKLQLDEDIYLMAILTDCGDITNKGTSWQVDCTFTCYDPYYYGKEHTETLASGANTFEVVGGCEVWPEYALTSPGGDIVITNTDTDEAIKVLSIKSGVKVAITTQPSKRKVLIGGQYYAVDLSSDFFSLDGTANIKLSGAAGTLTYQERYL